MTAATGRDAATPAAVHCVHAQRCGTLESQGPKGIGGLSVILRWWILFWGVPGPVRAMAVADTG